MIRFQRSGKVKNGKLQDGMRFAKEVSEYINAKYAPISVQAFSELFGDMATIHWHVDYDDLAALESIHTKLLADQEYWAIVNKGTDCYIDGSFQDSLISSI
jgi:hypothetical protein